MLERSRESLLDAPASRTCLWSSLASPYTSIIRLSPKCRRRRTTSSRSSTFSASCWTLREALPSYTSVESSIAVRLIVIDVCSLLPFNQPINLLLLLSLRTVVVVGVVMLDLKSENVFITAEPRAEGDSVGRCVIGDFDTAKKLSRGVVAMTVIGTV